MNIRSLSLANFRIYKEAEFTFEKNVNGIIGDNAVGKTTLLEAIYVALFGRSFRTLELKDLIKEGEDFFRIEIDFIKNDIEQKIIFIQGTKERRIWHNSTQFTQLSSLLGILHGVLIAPGDMQLIMGAPSDRRRFLDIQLSQTDPLYVHHCQRYARAMRQRNCLLKTGNLNGIIPFEKEMASSASYITYQRFLCIQELSILCRDIYFELSEEPLHIQYISECNGTTMPEIEQFYLNTYNKLRSKELLLGYTLQGPHKNDISFLLDQKEARYFSSEGQKNSIIAALKLGEWTLVARRSRQKPLLLIDDLSWNLDAKRLHKLGRQILETGQCLFSAVSKPPFSFGNTNWIIVNN